MKTILLIMALVFAPLAFTGCTTPRTTEAMVYDSFRTAYNSAKIAYMGHLELVVKGKVGKTKELAVDQAWDRFRATFSIAFQAASQNWSAVPPEQVTALANQLINLIRTL